MADPTYNRLKSTQYAQFYEWLLTAADPTATLLDGLGDRNDQTVMVYQNAGGFNGATVQIHGDCLADGETDKTVALDDTAGNVIEFTSDSKPKVILPNVNRIKPVVSAGTLGANGVVVALMVTSGFSRFR